MRIAVFGATGVVGRALVPRLAERNEVVAVSRHAQPARRVNVETATADVTDAPAVRRVLVVSTSCTTSSTRWGVPIAPSATAVARRTWRGRPNAQE